MPRFIGLRYQPPRAAVFHHPPRPVAMIAVPIAAKPKVTKNPNGDSPSSAPGDKSAKIRCRKPCGLSASSAPTISPDRSRRRDPPSGLRDRRRHLQFLPACRTDVIHRQVRRSPRVHAKLFLLSRARCLQRRITLSAFAVEAKADVWLQSALPTPIIVRDAATVSPGPTDLPDGRGRQFPVQPPAKIFTSVFQKSVISSRHPIPMKRGVSRSSRTWRRDAVDAAASGATRIAGRAKLVSDSIERARRTALLRTAKACGPGTRCWCQVWRRRALPNRVSETSFNPQATVAKGTRHRGEHEVSR